MTWNWCEFLAEALRQIETDATIYSNLDPSREWRGEKMVEFSTREIRQKNFISGDFQQTFDLSALARSETETDARQTAFRLSEILRNLLTRLKQDGAIDGWALEEVGASPDARGLVNGESFYGYVDFSITEAPITLQSF